MVGAKLRDPAPVHVTRQVYESLRVIRIDNSGPVVTMSISPSFAMPYVMDNFNPSTASVTYVSGPAISSVTFLKVLNTTTTLIGG